MRKKTMIRTKTIAKRAKEINELATRAMDLEAKSEAEYGFVTEKTRKAAEKLEAKAEKIHDDTIAKMHADGLCSEYGLTSEEADRLGDIGCDCPLWELGNGDWC